MTSQLGEQAQVARATARFVRVTPLKARRDTARRWPIPSQLGAQAPVARAAARFVRVTPMKARRVVDLVRYLPADEALALLRFAPQSASEPVAQGGASAVA